MPEISTGHPHLFLNPSRGETIVISVWDVYWVMQLDTILTMLVFASLSGAVITAASWMMWADDDYGAPILFPALVTPVWLLCVLLTTFLPSSRTAAAMLILPALASDTVVEAVAPEARELYDLAKDALRSVSTKAATPAAVEPKPEK